MAILTILAYALLAIVSLAILLLIVILIADIMLFAFSIVCFILALPLILVETHPVRFARLDPRSDKPAPETCECIDRSNPYAAPTVPEVIPNHVSAAQKVGFLFDDCLARNAQRKSRKTRALLAPDRMILAELVENRMAHEGLSVESPFTWTLVRGGMEGEPTLRLDRSRPWISPSPN